MHTSLQNLQGQLHTSLQNLQNQFSTICEQALLYGTSSQDIKKFSAKMRYLMENAEPGDIGNRVSASVQRYLQNLYSFDSSNLEAHISSLSFAVLDVKNTGKDIVKNTGKDIVKKIARVFEKLSVSNEINGENSDIFKLQVDSYFTDCLDSDEIEEEEDEEEAYASDGSMEAYPMAIVVEPGQAARFANRDLHESKQDFYTISSSLEAMRELFSYNPGFLDNICLFLLNNAQTLATDEFEKEVDAIINQYNIIEDFHEFIKEHSSTIRSMVNRMVNGSDKRSKLNYEHLKKVGEKLLVNRGKECLLDPKEKEEMASYQQQGSQEANVSFQILPLENNSIDQEQKKLEENIKQIRELLELPLDQFPSKIGDGQISKLQKLAQTAADQQKRISDYQQPITNQLISNNLKRGQPSSARENLPSKRVKESINHDNFMAALKELSNDSSRNRTEKLHVFLSQFIKENKRQNLFAGKSDVEIINAYDEHGRTLFYAAIEQACPWAIRILVDFGGDINKLNEQKIPLLNYAIKNVEEDKQYEILTELLNCGVYLPEDSMVNYILAIALEKQDARLLAAIIEKGGLVFNKLDLPAKGIAFFKDVVDSSKFPLLALGLELKANGEMLNLNELTHLITDVTDLEQSIKIARYPSERKEFLKSLLSAARHAHRAQIIHVQTINEENDEDKVAIRIAFLSYASNLICEAMLSHEGVPPLSFLALERFKEAEARNVKQQFINDVAEAAQGGMRRWVYDQQNEYEALRSLKSVRN